MIPLIPYRKLIIDTPLTQQDAINKLSAEVAPQQWFRFKPDPRQQLFEGFVTKSGFQIARIIRYRNSFLPILYGRFYPRETGLQIQVVMTLHPLILIIAVVLGFYASLFVLTSLYHLISTGNFDDRLKSPFAIIVFVYLLFTLGFGFEASLASRLLKRIFAAEQTPETVT